MSKQSDIREGINDILRDKQFRLENRQTPLPVMILDYLHSQGVVIKVDGELPRPKHVTDETWEWMNDFLIRTRKEYIKAGYVAVEPLIDKGER